MIHDLIFGDVDHDRPRPGADHAGYAAAESWLIAALPFDFWMRVKFAPRCDVQTGACRS